MAAALARNVLGGRAEAVDAVSAGQLPIGGDLLAYERCAAELEVAVTALADLVWPDPARQQATT